MGTSVKVIVVTVENASTVTGSASLANQMIQAKQQNTQGFNLVNQGGQLIATVSNLFPILEPIRIQTNTFAAATVALKMTADVQAGQSIEAGDALTLVGDIAGVVAGIAVLAAAPELAVAATLVAVATDVASLVLSDEAQAVGNYVNQIVEVNWGSDPQPNTTGMLYLTNTNQFMTAEEMAASDVGFGVIVVTPDGQSSLGTAGESAGELPPSDDEGGGSADSGDSGEGSDDADGSDSDSGSDSDGDSDAMETDG